MDGRPPVEAGDLYNWGFASIDVLDLAVRKESVRLAPS